MTDLLKKRFDVARWIAKEIAGTLEGEERASLERWRGESPLHESEYGETRAYLLSREAPTRAERQMVKDEWRKFERARHGKRFIWRAVARYAALFMLPLCVAGYLWYAAPGRSGLPAADGTGIVPGGGKAVLILANGQSVELKDEKGLLVDTTGRVVVPAGERGVYRQIAARADSLAEEKYNTLVGPRGGEGFMELPDSTRVWLNSESKLYFPLRFKGTRRDVRLEGEGYFEVMPDSTAPFHVFANGADLRVLGTSFNVTAYRGRTIATLVEGRVCLTHGGESVLMLPGVQAEVLPGSGGIRTREVNVKEFVLWKDGIFYFEGADLATIMERLARWYDVNVNFDDEELGKLRFSVEMKRYEHIQDLLTKIEKTRKVRFRIEGREIRVGEYREPGS